MKNLRKLLLAAVLVAAALATAPKAAYASPACTICNQSGGTNCTACCLCDGGDSQTCYFLCH
ncbi:MAG TPA: hypothetical protein VF173_05390 [Thermoanaerobaculia bacterium]|nr:hypothetical protein [Thermoanaerobaculia bacterium]